MIRFDFKIKNKTISATVPENWNEVTLEQILRLETEWTGEPKDMIGLLAAFTGENFSSIENAKGNLWEPLFQVMSFVFDAPKWKKLKKPNLIELGDKKVKPPRKLELETFGQKVLAMQALTKEGSEVSKIPEVLAIYLQPVYDGKFVTERIEDIKPMVLNMKAFESMPYGIFFLKNLLRSKRYGMTGLKVSRKMLKNLVSISKLEVRNSPNLAT